MLERGSAALLAWLAVSLLLGLLRRRSSAHALSWLALLPLVLLVLPLERMLPLGSIGCAPIAPLRALRAEPTLESSSSPVLPRALDATDSVEPADVALVDAVQPRAGTREDRTTEPTPHGSTALLFAFAAWIAGAIASLAQLAWIEARSRRFLRRAAGAPAPNELALFERVRQRSGCDTRVRLRLIPGLPSPATGGLLRPVLYAPVSLFETLPAHELRWVLLHELAHVRRRDVWVALFERAVLAAWWFFPVAWLARAQAARWRELACDEAALAGVGERSRASSSSALLRLATASVEPLALRASLAPLCSPPSFLRTRIMRLLDTRRAPARGLSLSGLLLVIAATCGTLALARPQDELVSTSAPRAEIPALRRGAALWLARRQQSDGRWTVSADPTVRTQGELNEITTTALAVRALLGEQQDGASPELEAAVRKGATFLGGAQHEDGGIGPRFDQATMIGHAHALRALAETGLRFPDAVRKEQLERAVAFALRAQNPYLGWRYAITPDGDNDSKITAAMLLALDAAQRMGIDVPRHTQQQALALLDHLTNAETGRTGFVSPGTLGTRYVWKRERFPAEFSEEPTALTLLARVSLGKDLSDSPTTRRGVALLVERLPLWSIERGSIDYTYWMHGAQAIAHAGGYAASAWRAALQSALLEGRIAHADGSAHWPAIDAWSEPGMEPLATACSLLALQAL
jgi:beta-lactamase regulating signal transducer with metallopeptidase domain